MAFFTKLLSAPVRASGLRFLSVSSRILAEAAEAQPAVERLIPQANAQSTPLSQPLSQSGVRSNFGAAQRRNRDDAKVLAQGVTGHVKWFSVQKGFGFITRADNQEDIFVHFSSIANKNPAHFVRSLDEGETVQFDVIEGDKGAEAYRVSGPNGVPVRGSPFAEMPPNRGPFFGAGGPNNQFRGGFRGGFNASNTGGYQNQPGPYGSGGGGFQPQQTSFGGSGYGSGGGGGFNQSYGGGSFGGGGAPAGGNYPYQQQQQGGGFSNQRGGSFGGIGSARSEGGFNTGNSYQQRGNAPGFGRPKKEEDSFWP